MPVITTKVNIALDAKKEAAMTAAFKKCCNTRLGKGEEWVMTIFEQNANITFRDSKQPAAFVNVQSYGPIMASPAEHMTQDITDAVQKATGIPSERIYICYYGAQCFGWDRRNFA